MAETAKKLSFSKLTDVNEQFQHIMKLYQKAKKMMIKAKIPIKTNATLVINNRLKSTLGQYWRIQNRIELSPKFLSLYSNESCLSVLIHELIHTCKNCLNHGKTFQQYAKTLNQMYHLDLGTYGDINNDVQQNADNFIAQSKYVFRCKKCGYIHCYDRITNYVVHPELYTCIRCGNTGFNATEIIKGQKELRNHDLYKTRRMDFLVNEKLYIINSYLTDDEIDDLKLFKQKVNQLKIIATEICKLN